MARPPTDPALVEDVVSALTEDGQTAAEIAAQLAEDERAVKSILDSLVKDGDAFADGRGKRRRYYVIGEDG